MEPWIQPETPEVPVLARAAQRVPRRSFEGLFEHSLRPGGEFARALRDVGYDPLSVEDAFSLKVWRASLEVARRHACPGLEEGAADRVLGKHFVDGFAQTLVGRIFAAALPLLGAERCLARLPTYVRAGREDMRVEMEAVHSREWRARVEDLEPLPDFAAGVVEHVLRRARVLPRVDVLERSLQGFRLRIRWDDA